MYYELTRPSRGKRSGNRATDFWFAPQKSAWRKRGRQWLMATLISSNLVSSLQLALVRARTKARREEAELPKRR